MTTNNIANGKKVNSIFRRSELKFIIIFGILINLVIAILINLFFIIFIDKNYMQGSTIFNPIAYISSIKSNIIFNFASMSIVSIIISTFYSYYLYIEAIIQFKNRKYYLTVDDNFLNIFNFPLSLIFSLLISVLFSFSLLNFIKQISPSFNPTEVFIPLFFMIFIIPGAIIFFYYYQWQKRILFNMLSFWNNVANTTKREINDQIYNAKINNTSIWLILIRISNINEICDKYKKNMKFILKIIIKNFKAIIRNSDFIIKFSHNKGLIGYIVDNDQKSLNELLAKKIKPFLANKVKYKDETLDLVLNYQIIDMTKNEDINNLSDILSFVKNTSGKNL